MKANSQPEGTKSQPEGTKSQPEGAFEPTKARSEAVQPCLEQNSPENTKPGREPENACQASWKGSQATGNAYQAPGKPCLQAVRANLEAVRASLPKGVGLVAVSKFHPVEELQAAYDAGQRTFGESRVQELLVKIPALPADINWHFIGHLQTNKVRQIVGKVALIESVDTEHLLEYIDRESLRAGVVTRVLMQVHVAQEETKFGFAPDELAAYFNDRKFENLKATHICGIMGMASNTDDVDRINADFAAIAKCFNDIRNNASLGLRGFDILSMGMSDDRNLAIANGSNLVRVGTAIFGPREY